MKQAKTPILMAMLRDLQSAGVAEHHAVEARVCAIMDQPNPTLLSMLLFAAIALSAAGI
jgi:hypothetical protein